MDVLSKKGECGTSILYSLDQEVHESLRRALQYQLHVDFEGDYIDLKSPHRLVLLYISQLCLDVDPT